MDDYELGTKYSKLTIEARKKLIKKYSAKIKEIDKISDRRKKAYDKLTKTKQKLGDERELRRKITLLKHTYHVGDYIVIKQKTKDEKNHKVCKVLRLVNIKDYVVADTTHPFKNSFTELKVNEKHILCNVEAIQSIPTLKYYNENWQGKIPGDKNKI